MRLLVESDNTVHERHLTPTRHLGLTKALEHLGYGWRLECVNALSNLITVTITKNGATFALDAASSGEKEILAYSSRCMR